MSGIKQMLKCINKKLVQNVNSRCNELLKIKGGQLNFKQKYFFFCHPFFHLINKSIVFA